MGEENFLNVVNEEFERVRNEHADMQGSFQAVNNQHEVMLSTLEKVQNEHIEMNRDLKEIKDLLKQLLDK